VACFDTLTAVADAGVTEETAFLEHAMHELLAH
jgi:hypothetical protein